MVSNLAIGTTKINYWILFSLKQSLRALDGGSLRLNSTIFNTLSKSDYSILDPHFDLYHVYSVGYVK